VTSAPWRFDRAFQAPTHLLAAQLFNFRKRIRLMKGLQVFEEFSEVEYRSQSQESSRKEKETSTSESGTERNSSEPVHPISSEVDHRKAWKNSQEVYLSNWKDIWTEEELKPIPQREKDSEHYEERLKYFSGCLPFFSGNEEKIERDEFFSRKTSTSSSEIS